MVSAPSQAKLPPKPRGRTILARSCKMCCKLLPPSRFYPRHAECKDCTRAEDAKRVQLPPKPFGRTLLAQTCLGCGLLFDIGDFPAPKSSPRCRPCMSVKSGDLNRRWRAEHPDQARKQKREHWAKQQADSLASAHRWGYLWTGPEMELLRDDLSTPQIAEMIGRTVRAVSMQRSMVRRDPRKAGMAGLIPHLSNR